MLLDLDAATLTVYVNGERKGVMVRPGMIGHYDADHPSRSGPIARLQGPVYWVADLVGGGEISVAIDGSLPLPAHEPQVMPGWHDLLA